MKYKPRSGNNWTKKYGQLRRRYTTISRIRKRVKRRRRK